MTSNLGQAGGPGTDGEWPAIRLRLIESLEEGLSLLGPTVGPGLGRTIDLDVPRDALRRVCRVLHQDFGFPLVSGFGADERRFAGSFAVRFVFSAQPLRFADPRLQVAPPGTDAFVVVRSAVPEDDPQFPSITPDIPAAHWYEREIRDMFGLTPAGHPDPRRLCLHQDWPEDIYPLRKDVDADHRPPRADGHFHFRKVEGEGVMQVPVGPIHAGIIEPGHFRFSAVGENVLQLEARLFYTHRGVEKNAEGASFDRGLLIAERVCGACSFSHASAYCQAVEILAGLELPERAAFIRTLGIELERLYNHIGDVGNICAGIGLAVGVMSGAGIKESLMQLNERIAGNRFLRGWNAIGGLKRDLDGRLIEDIGATLARAEQDFADLADLLLATPSYLDRVKGTGRLATEVARDLGVVGPAARASGIDADFRRDHPHLAYPSCTFVVPIYTEEDVLSRVRIRIDEAFQSFAIIRQLLSALPSGPVRLELKPGELDAVPAHRSTFGYVESPRGSVVHYLMSGPGGVVERYMVRSASYCNWAAVPFAVPGNIIPDFPLINKSFELCYSCLDR
ncbi:MAG: NADH-quinone oxidoreductase subunit C [Actinobacteria bacterium]|nr:NADH-quinone oxidoreductase subunit C [Actinomycetota bacterium]